MKTVVVLSILLALAAAVGGGYYYYTEIYQVREYAKTVVPLYEQLGAPAMLPDSAGLKDAVDYSGALRILGEKKQTLVEVRARLIELIPPRKMKDFHKEFISTADILFSVLTDAEIKARFLDKALKLRQDLQSSTPQPDNFPKNPLIKDAQKFFNDTYLKIRSSGNGLFIEEIVGWEEPSFSELKLKWEEIKSGIDFVLTTINSLNPNLPIEKIGSLLSQQQNERGEGVFRNIEKFSETLNALTSKHSAHEILSLGSFKGISQVEMSESAFKIYNQIQELKKKYIK